MDLNCVYRKRKEADSWTEPPDLSRMEQILSPSEVALFKHYLEHTSRDRTVADQDRYTMQVGIPNLACQSKPLMRSVLALAAMCKCWDIINDEPSRAHTPAGRGEIVDLVSLAHQYHLGSLHETQATLCEADNYDHVLANASMMGMYGSASHAARVWLAKTAPPGEHLHLLDCMLLPGTPQWLSLFRAVRLAYAGLFKVSPQHSPPVSPAALSSQYEYKVGSKAQQAAAAAVGDVRATIMATHPLGPVVGATVGSALARLNEKASEIRALHHHHHNHHYVAGAEVSVVMNNDDAGINPQLEACFTALGILNNIMTETVLSSQQANSSIAPSTPGHHEDHDYDDDGDDYDHARPRLVVTDITNDPVGRLEHVSPWLRRYTASISSMIPSQVPRRVIMSLVHKVPTAFLNLVEDVINNLVTPAASAAAAAVAGPVAAAAGTAEGRPTPEQPSPAHQLALEIFAHWLVLIMLLDDVWWIGGIGAWELARFVSVRGYPGWEACLWNWERDWWPESMLEVSHQLEKYR